MATELTNELLAGFDAEPDAKPPYLATSPSWLAWMLGRYMATRQIARPTKVTASRGDNIRADRTVWVPITSSRILWRRA